MHMIAIDVLFKTTIWNGSIKRAKQLAAGGCMELYYLWSVGVVLSEDSHKQDTLYNNHESAWPNVLCLLEMTKIFY